MRFRQPWREVWWVAAKIKGDEFWKNVKETLDRILLGLYLWKLYGKSMVETYFEGGR